MGATQQLYEAYRPQACACIVRGKIRMPIQVRSGQKVYFLVNQYMGIGMVCAHPDTSIQNRQVSSGLGFGGRFGGFRQPTNYEIWVLGVLGQTYNILGVHMCYQYPIQSTL